MLTRSINSNRCHVWTPASETAEILHIIPSTASHWLNLSMQRSSTSMTAVKVSTTSKLVEGEHEYSALCGKNILYRPKWHKDYYRLFKFNVLNNKLMCLCTCVCSCCVYIYCRNASNSTNQYPLQFCPSTAHVAYINVHSPCFRAWTNKFSRLIGCKCQYLLWNDKQQRIDDTPYRARWA